MPKGYPLYVLGVMVGINFLNYMDRFILTAVAPVVQKEFRLNDTELGALATAFLLVYAVAALPFGFWADRGIRRTVIGVGVTIWSLATVVTGFVGSYWQLLLSRAVVGIGEASYYPAGTSLVADYFPQSSRARAMSIWGAGTAFGIAVGFIGAGFIAEYFGWRYAFFMALVPGLIFAILAFTLREPLRGSSEKAGPRLKTVKAANLRTFLGLWKVRTLRATIMAQTVLFFVLAANVNWLPVFLVREYHLKVSLAATLAGGVVVAGGLIGTLAGGWLADWRNRLSPRGNLEVVVVGLLSATLFFLVALLAPNFPIFVAGFLMSVIAIYFHAGPITAQGQNVVIPSLRASAVTFTLFIAHVFGDSYSPFVVGILSDALHSLKTALLITSPPLLLLAAALAFSGMKTAGDDQEAMERTWAATHPGDAVPTPA